MVFYFMPHLRDVFVSFDLGSLRFCTVSVVLLALPCMDQITEEPSTVFDAICTASPALFCFSPCNYLQLMLTP